MGWNEEVSLDKVIVATRVSKYLSMSMVPNNLVCSDQTVVFASSDFGLFAILFQFFIAFGLRNMRLHLELALGIHQQIVLKLSL